MSKMDAGNNIIALVCDLIHQISNTLISQLPDKIRKIQILHFFARNEAVWIQAFKFLASKLKELFEVKDGV